MKVSVSWLKNLVEFNNDIDELAEKLSMTGFEVESLEDLSAQAKNVVIGYVDEITPHPNAEKLKVCSVDVGLPKKLSIVCGAPNVKAGYHVLVAKVGAYLSSKSLNIKLSNLRGVESAGMICSLDELGIESSNEGIEILEENERNIFVLRLVNQCNKKNNLIYSRANRWELTQSLRRITNPSNCKN